MSPSWEALVEYLATTFALSDDETRKALSEFLTREGDGIFRGPYLSVRTPFRHVADDWAPPLEWLPDDFVPYAHQAASFNRLSSVGGRNPEPTLVTTGTGSGKTECFLYPMLDHCARMRDEGRRGIKALILYPMNALASDQAGRIAELIASETRLAGLTAGLYVGEAGRNSTMGPDHVIDKREAIRADPPDILMTNYKMLDFLLLRNDDRELWAGNDPDTLQYVVLDEFHTYDGAQPPESVIGERRQSVDEACEPVNYRLPIPNVDDVLGLTELEDVAKAFCVSPHDGSDWRALGTDDDARVDLGEVLLAHPLTWAVLSAVGERPRSWPEAVKEIVFRAPNWGRTHQNEPLRAEQALAQFLWLLSEARRRRGARLTPLFSVEIQLWIREVSRLLRKVQPEPSFRWRDSSAPVSEDDTEGGDTLELPSTYCRQCGMSGWMAIASETSDALSTNAGHIYRSSVQGSPLARTMLVGHPDDEAVRWFSPIDHTLSDTRSEDALPVLVTDGEDDAGPAAALVARNATPFGFWDCGWPAWRRCRSTRCLAPTTWRARSGSCWPSPTRCRTPRTGHRSSVGARTASTCGR
ncbi:MAG: DEAD/DEAH box helicase [Candidatus Microthrix sp.]|nr:DEAD/DEAH box helicase [Candidatus Microthrix sp.]